jgi:hypothetical protein
VVYRLTLCFITSIPPVIVNRVSESARSKAKVYSTGRSIHSSSNHCDNETSRTDRKILEVISCVNLDALIFGLDTK